VKENKDTEAFDFDKSEIIEDRSYFENGKLLHQINNQDCGSPFSDNYLPEAQKSIKTDFDKLIKYRQNATMRLKRFSLHFVALPAKWIKPGRRHILKVFTTRYHKPPYAT